MEIFTLLEALEDILERSKTVPFTDKGIGCINEILDIPIYSNTNRLYKFEESKKCKKQGGCFVNGYCNFIYI